MRRADAVKIFRDGGLLVVDGPFECSVTVAARQGVGEEHGVRAKGCGTCPSQ